MIIFWILGKNSTWLVNIEIWSIALMILILIKMLILMLMLMLIVIWLIWLVLIFKSIAQTLWIIFRKCLILITPQVQTILIFAIHLHKSTLVLWWLMMWLSIEYSTIIYMNYLILFRLEAWDCCVCLPALSN